MAINPSGAVDVPCSLFAGLNTELAPSDIPEGVSPDNQDVVFLPGSVASRPALHKLYPAPLPNNPTILSQKSYTQPNGNPLTLVLDSNGKLWKEDVANAPGVLTVLPAVVAAGVTQLQSVSAFGREYLAFSDGLHGADVPLQYDGSTLDRVSQDGPGVGPTVQNYLPAAAILQNSGAGASINITSITPSDFIEIQRPRDPDPTVIWVAATVLTATAHGLSAGQFVTIAGNTASGFNYNGYYQIATVPSPTKFTIPIRTTIKTTGTGGTVTSQAPALSRLNNVVLATTFAAHSFVPGTFLVITGITNTNQATVSAISRSNNVVTVTTGAAHGLPVNATIGITGVTDTSFNGTFVVTGVLSPTQFTYVQAGANASSSLGIVLDIWTGTFQVATVPSSTTFTYSNIGPDDQSTNTGTATPQGQVTVGTHSCVLMFLTRQGYITKPSRPVQFNANGSQQLLITNLPIGPPNVVARILAFTPAGGQNYFYIPVSTNLSNGQVVSSTVIPDNTSTAIVIDFSDNALMAALAIDIPGNNLFAQVVLGPVLGFFAYADRLLPWGEYNKLQNFTNMGFDGGFLASQSTLPLGWAVPTSAGQGRLTPARYSGFAWQITGDGSSSPQGMIQQSAYQDYLGIPIVSPNTSYIFRCWASVDAVTTGTLIAELFSSSKGSIATAQIAVGNIVVGGGFVQATFSAQTGTTIPADTLLRIYAQNLPAPRLLTIDECALCPSITPFLDTQVRISYAINPEAFDGVTGLLGPASDPNPIRTFFVLRDTLHIITAGRLHATNDNGTSEPSGWTVRERFQQCGGLSSRCAITGTDWAIWATRTGLVIYEGGPIYKISQEIQTIWDSINFGSQQRIWVQNDIVARRVYSGVPLTTATAPNQILVLDYRELDTGTDIASHSPIHISFTGKMIASDLSRKWSKWNISANAAASIVRPNNVVQFVVGGGTGSDSGTTIGWGQGGWGLGGWGGTAASGGFGNLYYFDPLLYTDDDYGQITPYYVTYFFTNHEQEQALGLGSHRKLYNYMSMFVSGIGILTITPLADSLTNAMNPLDTVPLSQTPKRDIGLGVNHSAERTAFKFTVNPLAGATDNYFQLNKIVVNLQQEPYTPVAGSIF